MRDMAGRPEASRSRWLGPGFDAPARRIVSLVPSLTEAVFALGAGEALAGRTAFCVEPRGAVDRVDVVGGTKDPDVKRVLALAPDVVLANREENTRERVSAIAREVPVLVTDPRSPEDVPELWRELGAVCGRGERAEREARKVEAELGRVRPERSERRPGFVYWVWRDPWLAAGRDTYISRLLVAAGWRNAVPERRARYPKLSPADAAALAPAAMLFSSEPYAFSLPRDLGAFGGDWSLAGEVWTGPEGALSVAVDGRAFGWYPLRTAEGLGRAATLRGVLRSRPPGTRGRRGPHA